MSAPAAPIEAMRYELKAPDDTSTGNVVLTGAAKTITKPAGARVFLNGDLQGYSPLTMQTLPIGKHLMRIERPGFKQLGVMLEVTPEDQDITQELTATAGYKAFDALMDRLAGEALKDKGGQTMSSVASSLKLDRAVIGVLREAESGESTELTMAYFDLKTGRRIAIKRASFQGDEFGQLKGEVARMVNHLLNAEGTGEKVSRSADPLDNKHGMEEWQGEDRGGRNITREKKSKGGDPLDNQNGTEDW